MSFRVLVTRARPVTASKAASFTGRFAMPLRSKILAAGFASQGSTEIPPVKEIIREEPGDEPQDVLFNNLYGLRSIELNRPSKLNSLNASMVRKIVPRLIEWEKSDLANIVIMKGVGRALCAGGDVAALAQMNKEGPEGQAKSTDYFALEYKLDHYIATYQKPYIAFMDGITMGGGVGLSIHAPFRIATENTVFSMPETTIGFFPDVGASFFLPKMPGAVGTYLALTSERLKGVNVFYSGIATHYLHSSSLPNLEARLAELRFKDYDTMEERLAIVEMTIEEYTTGIPHDQPMLLQGELRKAIDRCFSNESIETIIAALEQEEGATKEWAQKTLATLHKRSPTAVHVSLKQMRVAEQWSIKETFEREHQIAAKFMQHPDFTEGVTALLVEKREPKWQPATLDSIKPQDNVSDPFFSLTGGPRKLELLTDRDYDSYPHAAFGVPSEKNIEKFVRKKPSTQSEIIDHFVRQKRGRQGIREVVSEVLERMTETAEDGKAVWVQ